MKLSEIKEVLIDEGVLTKEDVKEIEDKVINYINKRLNHIESKKGSIKRPEYEAQQWSRKDELNMLLKFIKDNKEEK